MIATGDRYGRLTVVRETKAHGERRRYICKCECGKTTTVRGSNLTTGNVRSCGCLRVERSAARATTHGHTAHYENSPEYEAWRSMKNRCYAPGHDGWAKVGGKGIKVCERWCNSFENFLDDLGPRPSAKHLLNRIDKKKHYTPDNTRWATIEGVGRTRSDNRFYTVGNVTLCLQDWAKRAGIGKSTLHYRLAKGLTMRDAIDRGNGGQGRVIR